MHSHSHAKWHERYTFTHRSVGFYYCICSVIWIGLSSCHVCRCWIWELSVLCRLFRFALLRACSISFRLIARLIESRAMYRVIQMVWKNSREKKHSLPIERSNRIFVRGKNQWINFQSKHSGLSPHENFSILIGSPCIWPLTLANNFLARSNDMFPHLFHGKFWKAASSRSNTFLKKPSQYT